MKNKIFAILFSLMFFTGCDFNKKVDLESLKYDDSFNYEVEQESNKISMITAGDVLIRMWYVQCLQFLEVVFPNRLLPDGLRR